MINFPHTLPLPDLNKQGRAEEWEAEGGEKESLGCSNCTSAVQLILKQLREGANPPGGTGGARTARSGTGAHTLPYGWQRISP